MIKVDIIAIGRLKPGPIHDLYQNYNKRLQWPIQIHELTPKSSSLEHTKILDQLRKEKYTIALDERGQSLTSRAFSNKLQDCVHNNENSIQFIIGGADGLNQEIRQKANFLMSFGKQTWPHMMTRVMLMEQLYRAQQIMNGHPYHRD